MDLKGILSIAGQPGLFKLVSQMKGGLVVESLLDGRRMPAYTTQRILSLEDISIYTDSEEIPLADVFDRIIDKEGGKVAIDPKAASVDELRSYLEAILPNYDRDRVYTSDIKKMFVWYNILAEKGLAVKSEAEGESEDEVKPKGKKSETAKTEKATDAASKPKKSAPKKQPLPKVSKGKTATTAVRKAGKA